MRSGTQFSGTVPANGTSRWYTFNWPQAWQVVWTVVPKTPAAGGGAQGGGVPQLDWEVQVERASADYATYWITVKNLTATPLEIEACYAVLNS